jgi:hypothetical protein
MARPIARKVTAAPAEHRFQHRKQRKDLVGNELILAGERRVTAFEIFLDGEQREDLAALRYIADTVLGAVIGSETVQHLPLEADGSGTDGMLAGYGTQKRTLPNTVAS